MSGDQQFWLGIIISIPIGIATGLISPIIQRKIEQKSKEKAIITNVKANEEREKITKFYNNPDEFTHFLIHTAIKTTFIGALLASLSGFSFVFAQILTLLDFRYNDSLQSIYLTIGQFMAVIGSLMIVNTCRYALSIWVKVKNYEEYNQNNNHS